MLLLNLVNSMTIINKNEFYLDKEKKSQKHPFMDGFYLSNTPLREVLEAHRDYWLKIRETDDVPSLEIYTGDLYTSKEKWTPLDPDTINNRVQNVLFCDKSKYDEKAAAMVSDYALIVNEMVKMLQDKGITEELIYEELNNRLQGKVLSKSRKGQTRQVQDLIKWRGTINKICRIEYGELQKIIDSGDVAGKAFEFSSKTIKNLIEKGYEDTCKKCKFK